MTYDKDSFLAGLSVGMSLRYSKIIPAPPNYLTFSSPSSFTLSVNNATKNWDGTLESSTDKRTWTVWDGTTTLTSARKGNNYYLYLRGSGNTVISGSSSNKRWVLTGSLISCVGDIRYLLEYSDVENSVMASYCFGYLFYNCTDLISAPNLPATTLSVGCYSYLFWGCEALTNAPALPATTLAISCYEFMFAICTSLTTAPLLPATTLEQNCYNAMFNSCTSLTAAPLLPATNLESYCYYAMFGNCRAITNLPSLPATTLKYRCYYNMFANCTGIKVSETQTGEYQTPYRIPENGVGTMATDALKNMFNGTGGTFTGTPTINTTYYTSNTVIS